VSFENFSTGDVDNYDWYFEGGTPETSTDENPIVKYSEAGDFDVRLIVNNGISLDTTLKTDYIEVQELPEISFVPLPDFCQDDPPYELTEGYPEEGNYFGLFVDTGYFHPMLAGPGTHSVYFAYQDDETFCSDTLSQAVMVDICEAVNGINETEWFRWFCVGDHLYLEFNGNLSSSITQIFIYNLQGQQIENIILSDQNEISWDIPPHLQCFILVLNRNKTNEVIKICR